MPIEIAGTTRRAARSRGLLGAWASFLERCSDAKLRDPIYPQYLTTGDRRAPTWLRVAREWEKIAHLGQNVPFLADTIVTCRLPDPQHLASGSSFVTLAKRIA